MTGAPPAFTRPVVQAAPYSVPRAAAAIDLFLDGNEGPPPPASLLAELPPEALRSYPDARPLEADIARAWDLDPSQVVVTAGADDALDRLCRATLEPGHDLVLPRPGFAMLERYAAIAGGARVGVPWPDGPLPTAALRAAVTPTTSLLVVTSPNNPTGAVATAADLDALQLPGVIRVLDAAYAEFADEDVSRAALDRGWVVVRTLSKAWGLAGLRVGWAMGPAPIIDCLRSAGAPYAVAAPSLAIARLRLRWRDDVDAFVAQVRIERAAIEQRLRALGAACEPSQANFVFCRVPRPLALRDALGEQGIAIRAFPERPELGDAIRIACPGDGGKLSRLLAALDSAFAAGAGR